MFIITWLGLSIVELLLFVGVAFYFFVINNAVRRPVNSQTLVNHDKPRQSECNVKQPSSRIQEPHNLLILSSSYRVGEYTASQRLADLPTRFTLGRIRVNPSLLLAKAGLKLILLVFRLFVRFLFATLSRLMDHLQIII